jgi:glycine betaine/proline transport system ATP-binding protein
MAEDALGAANNNMDLGEIMKREIGKVLPGTLLKDLFSQLSRTNLPLAVVDEKDKLLGAIVRGSVMAKLAERGVANG